MKRVIKNIQGYNIFYEREPMYESYILYPFILMIIGTIAITASICIFNQESIFLNNNIIRFIFMFSGIITIFAGFGGLNARHKIDGYCISVYKDDEYIAHWWFRKQKTIEGDKQCVSNIILWCRNAIDNDIKSNKKQEEKRMNIEDTEHKIFAENVL